MSLTTYTVEVRFTFPAHALNALAVAGVMNRRLERAGLENIHAAATSDSALTVTARHATESPIGGAGAGGDVLRLLEQALEGEPAPVRDALAVAFGSVTLRSHPA